MNKKGDERTFSFHDLGDALSYAKVLTSESRIQLPEEKAPKPSRKRPKVESDGPVREPIDRTARIVISDAPWWAVRMPARQQHEKRKEKRVNNQKATVTAETSGNYGGSPMQRAQGSRVRTDNAAGGEQRTNLEDLQRLIIQEIERMPKETRPCVREAEDARRILWELLEGIGGDMEKFRESTRLHKEEIRRNRCAMVQETSSMVKGLRDIRQFFMDDCHEKEIERLKEFVELCERLNALKESGFIDTVADTMLKLPTSKTE